MAKIPHNFRLNERTDELLATLKDYYGMTETDVVALAINELAVRVLNKERAKPQTPPSRKKRKPV